MRLVPAAARVEQLRVILRLRVGVHSIMDSHGPHGWSKGSMAASVGANTEELFPTWCRSKLTFTAHTNLRKHRTKQEPVKRVEAQEKAAAGVGVSTN